MSKQESKCERCDSTYHLVYREGNTFCENCNNILLKIIEIFLDQNNDPQLIFSKLSSFKTKAAKLMSEPKEIRLLEDILTTLIEMKKQEKEYWETWKKAKANEN